MDRFLGAGWFGEDRIPVTVDCSARMTGMLRMARPDDLSSLHQIDLEHVPLELEDGTRGTVCILQISSRATRLEARFVAA